MRITRLNGTVFEVMVRGGLINLCNHEKEINDMNVFPGPDGDTGHNMRLTLENGIKNAVPNSHLGNYIKQLAYGMLLGARGNSGVILSQLFRGMAEELQDKSIVNAGELRNAFVRAYKTAYAAVIRPVEGTILTVSREGIENIVPQIRRGTTVDMVMSMYLGEMKKSVRHTPDMLSMLREAGVLDSGAVGYITIIEGMTRSMFGERLELKDGSIPDRPVSNVVSSSFGADSSFTYGYCLEFLLQLLNSKAPVKQFDLKGFIKEITTLGNSLVAIRSGDIIKVHIHTFVPERIIAFARRYGEFVTFKLENMEVQHEDFVGDKDDNNVNGEKPTDNGNGAKVSEATVTEETAATADDDLYSVHAVENKPEHKILAVVSVADGEGITEILKGCGSDIVLSGGQTMNTPSEDFIKAFRSLNADRIVVLPDNENITQTAVQAAEICGISDKVAVLSTRSVLEGYYALAMGSPDIENADERIEQMKIGAGAITTVSVTQAVRDYTCGEYSCKKGDYIGVVGKTLVSDENDAETALIKAIEKIDDLEDKSTVIILTGAGVSDNRRERLDLLLEEKFPDLGHEFLEGGQKTYDFIAGVV